MNDESKCSIRGIVWLMFTAMSLAFALTHLEMGGYWWAFLWSIIGLACVSRALIYI